MMNDGDELIEILNGLVREERSQLLPTSTMYMNDEGKPTDDFLEALKVDKRQSQKRRDYSHFQRPRRNSVLYEDPSYSTGDDYDSYDDEDSRRYSSDDENLDPLKRNLLTQRNGERLSFMSRKPLHPSTSAYLPDEGQKERVNRKVSKKRANKKRATVKAQPVDKIYSLSSTDKATTKLNTASTSNSAVNKNTSVNISPVVDSDREAYVADLENKMNTLKLRLQGQQHTLRALEGQVASLTQALCTKDSELQAMQKRARSGEMQPKEQPKTMGNGKNTDTKKHDEEVKNLKVTT